MKYTIFGKQILDALDKKALFDIRDYFLSTFCDNDISKYHSIPIDVRIKEFASKYEKQIIDDINEKVLCDSPYRFMHSNQNSSYENSLYGDAELQDEKGNKILAVDFKWAAFTSHCNEVATPTRRSLENFGNNDNSDKHYYICFDKDFNLIETYNAKVAYESRKEAGDFDNHNDVDVALSSQDTRRFIKNIGTDISVTMPIFQYQVYNVSTTFDPIIESKILNLTFENIEFDRSLIIRYSNNNPNTLGNEYQSFLSKKTFVLNDSSKDDTSAMIIKNISDDENFITIHFASVVSKKSAEVMFKKQSKILTDFLKSGANKHIVRKINNEDKYYTIEFI